MLMNMKRILEERRFLFALMSHVGDFTTAQKSSIASILNEQVNIDNVGIRTYKRL